MINERDSEGLQTPANQNLLYGGSSKHKHSNGTSIQNDINFTEVATKSIHHKKRKSDHLPTISQKDKASDGQTSSDNETVVNNTEMPDFHPTSEKRKKSIQPTISKLDINEEE